MNTDVQRLVEETIEVTGADAPLLFADDSPALAKAPSGEGDEYYLIGLIGGKDVGKSSFVNALVGQKITEATSHGAGTEIVVAYAHRDALNELQHLLNREVPGHFKIHTHSIDRLRRQILLDLPDIDSIYDSHIEITRTMLRHMLYPIWIQSVEKYADQRPQTLLGRVAEGNDPANFLFCLNKADQIDPQQAAELRKDYAARLARLLKLPAPPKVHLTSAVQPDAHDLPALRAALSQEKSEGAVRSSQELAGRQQTRTVLAWLDEQQLAERAKRADHLLEDAQELTTARIGAPLLEEALPALQDDPAQRMAMTDPVMRARISRWPIVNVVDNLLAPLTLLVRQNVSAVAKVDLDAYLSTPLHTLVQTSFAQLQQTQPAAGALYRDNKLWENLPAESAADDLRRRVATTLDRQRKALVARIAGRRGIISPLLRFLLTIGAALWFPIIQPLLAIVAEQSWTWRTLDVARLAIKIFSAAYLLESVGFLVLYFIVLWAILRWHTHRRVARMIERWKQPDVEPLLSLSAQSIEWMDELLNPIRIHRDRLRSLDERVELLRSELNAHRAAA